MIGPRVVPDGFIRLTYKDYKVDLIIESFDNNSNNLENSGHKSRVYLN